MSAEDKDRIEYKRLAAGVYWQIFRPLGYYGTCNGVENNMRLAKKAASHALRMLDQWQGVKR